MQLLQPTFKQRPNAWRSSASLPVAHTFHVVPAPPTERASSATSRSADSHGDLPEALQSGTLRFALCPGDPGMLRGRIRDVGAAVERSAKPNTQRKGRSAWHKWLAFCRMLNTPEMRTFVDAHSGLGAFSARRERFMHACFHTTANLVLMLATPLLDLAV